MMRRIHGAARGATAATVAAVLMAAAPLAAQMRPDSGSFIVRLGSDTVAIESFVRTEDRLEAVTVTRTPRPLVHRLEVTFAADGAVRYFESTARDPSASAFARPAERTVATFDEFGIVVEEAGGVTSRIPRTMGAPAVFPVSTSFYSLYQSVVQHALDTGRDTVYVLEGDPAPLVIRRVRFDAVMLETPGRGTWRARVDWRGRILEMETRMPGRIVERVDWIDVDPLARRFAARDERRRTVDPLSPRDTAFATVHGASLSVAYGRPTRRGRTIFGAVVPWHEVWRTGANQATHFRTNRALGIGGTTLRAGTYTLYTIPAPVGWTLIINHQTGQWGTEYDRHRDVARLGMTARPLPADSAAESFTIAIDETEDGGLLRMRWARIEASIPFVLKSGVF